MPGEAPYIAPTVPQEMEGIDTVAGPARTDMRCTVTALYDSWLHMLLTRNPYGCIGWVISFATLPTISKGTTIRMWVITIYCHPGCEGRS